MDVSVFQIKGREIIDETMVFYGDWEYRMCDECPYKLWAAYSFTNKISPFANFERNILKHSVLKLLES